ncbi:MAG: hypothetical protein LUI04_02500 [Porphyromonadaceae bacterium]|nr:hypothetical protein [Porphyromonadaceae bacterium]
MDYKEFMSFAPKDCKPTVISNVSDYAKAKAAVAKKYGKEVKDLTSSEIEEALGRMGLSLLDIDLP